MRMIVAIFLALFLIGSSCGLKALEIPDQQPPLINPDILNLPPNDTEAECMSCDEAEEPHDFLDEEITYSCEADEIDLPDYEIYSGEYIHVDAPDYITEASTDCSLRGLDDNITQDLNEKLAILEIIEAEINETEDDIDTYLSEGQDAADCIRITEHGEELMSIPPLDLARDRIGTSHPSATLKTVVLRKLKNFYRELEFVYTANNYTNASAMTLESLSNAIQDNCRDAKCWYPENKEHYEDLLGSYHGDTAYYIYLTRTYIENARTWAQAYHDLKDNYINLENCPPQMIAEAQAIPDLINYSNETENETPAIDPAIMIAGQFEGVQNITYADGKYTVTTKAKRKLLWLFDVDMETIIEVDEDGFIISEQMPFWSFLLTG